LGNEEYVLTRDKIRTKEEYKNFIKKQSPKKESEMKEFVDNFLVELKKHCLRKKMGNKIEKIEIVM